MADIEKIKKLRRRSISVDMDAKVVDLDTFGNCIVIGYGAWRGLKSRAGIMLVEPIYDAIEVVPNTDCCLLRIQGVLYLFEMSLGKVVEVNMPLTRYKINDLNSTIEIETTDGKGLYSCRLHKVVVPPKYAEVTRSDVIRYLWVRTHDDTLGYYDTVSQEFIRCPDEAKLCLESNEDIMWVKVGNMVYAINESGIYDRSMMRKCALARKGRMRFYNHNYNETVITDIYGHIIN